MNDIMVDLETMSSRSDAAILSIGAVLFDPREKWVDWPDRPTFTETASLRSSFGVGLHIDPDTVMWWMLQPEEARRAITGPDLLPLSQILHEFSVWVHKHRDRKQDTAAVWGNGSDFDNVILRSAYDAVQQKAPWSHRGNRCYRTMRALFPDVPGYPKEDADKKHVALGDAILQARHLCDIFEVMRGFHD